MKLSSNLIQNYNNTTLEYIVKTSFKNYILFQIYESKKKTVIKINKKNVKLV